MGKIAAIFFNHLIDYLLIIFFNFLVAKVGCNQSEKKVVAGFSSGYQ